MPVKYRPLPKLSAKDIERFWSRVDKTPGQGPKGECWTWAQGARYKTGYGKFMKRKIAYGAHRVGFMIANGTDPGERCICHECDFKPCVRGSHLFKGTHAENAADMKRKGRSAVGDKNGMRTQPHRTSPGEKNGYAKLTDEQVREICRVYDAKEADQYQLARRFGVWQMTISRIVRRISRQTAHVSPV